MPPKSILKRVTRSTSNMLKQEQPSGVAGHGAFKRGRQDEPDDWTMNALPVSTPDVDEVERPSETISKPHRKRSRSEADRADDQVARPGSASHEVKRESSGAGLSNSKDDMTGRQDSFEPRRQENTSNTNASHGIQLVATHPSRRSSGAGAPRLHRNPSAKTPQVTGPRQPNVRTYGSQRTTGEPLAASGVFGSRLRPQSQSRYWARPKDESQESMTFSQGVGADENLLLPFQA